MPLLLLLWQRARLAFPQGVLVGYDEEEFGVHRLVRSYQLPALQRHNRAVGKRRMLRIAKEEVCLITAAELRPDVPFAAPRLATAIASAPPDRRRNRVQHGRYVAVLFPNFSETGTRFHSDCTHGTWHTRRRRRRRTRKREGRARERAGRTGFMRTAR